MGGEDVSGVKTECKTFQTGNVRINSLRLWLSLGFALDHEGFVILVRPGLHLEQDLVCWGLLDDVGRTLH